MNGKNKKSYYDILRDMAFAGGSGEPVPTKRTVYGTSDSKAYECADGRLYRVRKEQS